MKHNIILTAIAMAIASLSGSADVDTPRWLRNTAISPDGSKIAFNYKGDIFTVSSQGGDAVQLTSNSAYDSNPIWSPDGKNIVFASDREGSLDLYVVSSEGGNPRRLTTFSGQEKPLAFLDNNTLIYSTSELISEKTSRHPTRLTRTYSVDISRPKARPQLYLSLPIGAANADSGKRLLFQDKKGLENEYRKHERSSGTSDIWLYDNGTFNKLTEFNGHDLNPVWGAEKDKYYYVSEEDGTLNIYSATLNGTKNKLTEFERHPVRDLSISSGGTMAFSWDGDIYTLKEGSTPQKLDIKINADLYSKSNLKSFVTSNASYMAVSPDGKEVAFVYRGDVYVTDSKYKTTKRITNTPAQERVVSFSPDGRTLVYDSDRDGQWQLFTSEIKNPEEKRFAYATETIETPLYKGKGVAQQPSFSPDGKKVAFLEDRTTLRVLDLKTKKVNTALDGKYNYSYTDGDIPFEWSPDSRWLLTSYLGEGGWNNLDIAMVRDDGSELVDLTESGYSDGNPKWALNGRGVTYETARYGMKSHGSWGNQSDVVLMVLDGEAWDEFNASEEEIALKEQNNSSSSSKKEKDEKKKDKDEKKDKVAPLNPEFENRRHRMTRLTTNSAMIGDYYITPKGDKLYYTATNTEGGRSLYEHNLKKDETKMLIKDTEGALVPDAKGENIFVISKGKMKKLDLTAGTSEAVDFEAEYDRNPALEREYIFDHAVRQVADKFYDENLHGVDWKYYADHYREFLPYIENGEDFSILLSELLGELNASHTGARYYGHSASLSTPSLGAFFDSSYNGDGLKISEIVAGSPLDTKKASVKAGDLILSINGTPIKQGEDYYPLLEGRENRKTQLEILKTDGKKSSIEIKPISQSRFNDLLYKRWVERNEAYVDSISEGKIGYVHVQGMDSPSFRAVYERLLGKYRNADAVVVDTRWNGGGWLHNDLAVLLSGHRYVDFMPRGRYIGSEPFSQWYKPSVMLVGEGNYSDAHGSPYTYKTLGLGKLVGAPVPGTMTAVWWETQIDPSIVFGIPQVTNADLQGRPLENVQLNPDILIYNQPADELNGHDAQLEGAVKALLDQLK